MGRLSARRGAEVEDALVGLRIEERRDLHRRLVLDGELACREARIGGWVAFGLDRLLRAKRIEAYRDRKDRVVGLEDRLELPGLESFSPALDQPVGVRGPDADSVRKLEVGRLAEDGVDEPRGLPADALGELDRLVHGGMARNLVEVEDLEKRDAEVLADLGVDAVGALVDPPVELAPPAGRAVDERRQERAVAPRERRAAMGLERLVNENLIGRQKDLSGEGPNVLHSGGRMSDIRCQDLIARGHPIS